jgi:hypothetical protein
MGGQEKKYLPTFAPYSTQRKKKTYKNIRPDEEEYG